MERKDKEIERLQKQVFLQIEDKQKLLSDNKQKDGEIESLKKEVSDLKSAVTQLERNVAIAEAKEERAYEQLIDHETK